ncbi:NADH:flavin oxidoreductase/NADH oxidase family protein [Pacificimonas sp. WHA3]|uniref:NADH:flavin oxidoreductase/NADH oxidase family protein n=1 Tax=Pacificimonas pallii TaxID=2827236 RepID=A0ABS6SD31_9SPHN|nr:NADH:flavin oxidoreductase/NADH oxidase family protein [Pacificimonas pallii]MBV7256327.1 NADH:flavin oxidoreductase/NADH oxidase family protein [Pacificimonas pallii]
MANSAATPAETLSQALTLPNGKIVPNRLAKAAMTEGLADRRGRPSTRLMKLYETWAAGGAGLLLTGNVQIDADHLERGGNVVIDRVPDAEMRELLTAWAAAGKTHGGSMWMQVSHAGRQTQAHVNPHPKAPSAVKLGLPGGQFGEPVALTGAEIEQLIARFAVAGAAAYEAGFDGIQVHAAHGYLLSSFLNPRANQRDDQWGGSLENRARFLRRVVAAARAATSADFGISVKLNSADFQRGGFDFPDSQTVAAWLDEDGVDLIEISGGNYESPAMMDADGMELREEPEARRSSREREAYFQKFAPEIRARVKRAALMVTGGFRTAAGMADAVRKDNVDLVGLARPLCTRPELVRDLLAGTAEHLDSPERRLRLGPGFLSPSSSSKIVKALNGFGAQAWYYEQLVNFGEGRGYDETLGLLRAMIRNRGREKAVLAARPDQ